MAKKATTVTVKNSETALSMGDLINKIPEELKLQKQRLKELIGDNEDGTLSLDTTYDGRALKDFDSLTELISLHASLNARCKASNESAIILGLADRVVEWTAEGHNIEKWNALLVKASKTLLNKAEISSINENIKALEGFLPEEHKLMATLGKLLENGAKKLK